MDKKIDFKDFIASVDIGNQGFVKELHIKLMELGCKIEIKAASSGYMVSYSVEKKAVANYVFRKKGLIARIYGAHVNQCTEILETLPDKMVHEIQSASLCKRLVNPDSCNQKCSMGYDFWLKDEHYQKCRNSAFMFLLSPQSNPFIQSLLLKEVESRVQL